MLISYCMITFKIIIEELGNTCNAKIHDLILFQYVSGITFRYVQSQYMMLYESYYVDKYPIQ